MASSGQKVQAANKPNNQPVNHKRKLQPTSNMAVAPVSQARKIEDANSITSYLVTYKLACDVNRYGMTTELAKKLDFVEAKDRIAQIPVIDVMNRFVQKIVTIAHGVSTAEKLRTSNFIVRTGVLGHSFLVANHPFKWFLEIHDVERRLQKGTAEMLRLLEDVSIAICTIAPGIALHKEFEEVARKAGIFVRFFQIFMDAYENVRDDQQKRIVAACKILLTRIFNMQIDAAKDNAPTFQKKLNKHLDDVTQKLKTKIGHAAIQCVADYRLQHFKKHETNQLFHAPPLCVSGMDGVLTRRRH